MNKGVVFYTLPNASIIHELLGEEVIVADLDNGNYYSLNGAGATLWQLLMRGNSDVAAIAEMQAHYPAIADVKDQMTKFIEEVLGYKLLEVTETPIVNTQQPIKWPEMFVSPMMYCYGDMQQLLMLDPIHEVDELGWPHAKDSTS